MDQFLENFLNRKLWKIPDDVLQTISVKNTSFKQAFTLPKNMAFNLEPTAFDNVSYNFHVKEKWIQIKVKPTRDSLSIHLNEYYDRSAVREVNDEINEIISFLAEQYEKYLEAQPALRLRYATGEYKIETEFLE